MKLSVVVIIKDRLSIRQIGAVLANAVNMKTRPVCVYGTDHIPENAVSSSLLSDCLAANIFQIAEAKVKVPVYAGNEPSQIFCRCIGGPAWFGYKEFDPRLPGLISTGSPAAKQAGSI